MIKKIFSKFFSPEGNESINLNKGDNAHFVLSLEHLVVGELTLNNQIWSFQYSVHFKHQDEIKPLAEFSDMNKVYTSEVLWPFFAFRIPGLSQPHVQKLIDKYNLDKDNVVELLKFFGQESLNNPFKLVSTAA